MAVEVQIGLSEEHELENSAYIYVKHLQAEMAETLRTRSAHSQSDWEHIKLTFQRLEHAVNKHRRLVDNRLSAQRRGASQ